MHIEEHDIHYDQRYETLMLVRSLGAYAAAGRVLCLTPSAVAQQVHSVEKELGYALFTHHGKKLLPTKECDLIADFVSRVHSIKSRMEGELTLPSPDSRHLVLGATPSTQESILSDVLDLYQTNHPDVQITLHSGNREELEAMLSDHAIDLAVAEEDFLSKEISFVVLDTDHLVVAVSNNSTYANANGITLQQLQRENLIMRAGSSGTRTLFDANIRKAGLAPDHFKIMMELDNVSTIKKLVAKQYGVSVLSQKTCERDVQLGLFKTIPLLGVNMIRTIRIFYRKDDPRQSALNEIVQLYQSISCTDPSAQTEKRGKT